ncbi:MAG: tetratricopeptide repeat protein [Planctomycetota bacterium]
MAQPVCLYRVFIGSPGGLEAERKAFRAELHDHTESTCGQRGCVWLPIGWEDTLPGSGRPQERINEELRNCDAAIFVLHDRWGTPPSNDDSSKFTSGTEEEFRLAESLLKDPEAPMARIAVFFKPVDPSRQSDPGPHLSKVLEFKKHLEDSKTHLYQTVETAQQFAAVLGRLLHRWTYAHESVEECGLPPEDQSQTAPSASVVVDQDQQPQQTPSSSQSHDQSVDLDSLLAQAEELAHQGKITEAELHFSMALQKSPSPPVITRFGNFLCMLGRYEQARSLYERNLRTAVQKEDRALESESLGNLGLIFMMRGDLDEAESHFFAALSIDRDLGRLESQSIGLANLGLVAKHRGQLQEAVNLYQEAYSIDLKLGRLHGQAANLSNLGNIYQMLERYDDAMKCHKDSYEIFGLLRDEMRQGKTLSNVGIVAQSQGHLEVATDYLNRAYEISCRFQDLRGQALNLEYLGTVKSALGKIDEAELMMQRSLAIYNQIGAGDRAERVESRLLKISEGSNDDIDSAG